MNMTTLLAHGAPAGGAPLEDLIPATIVAAVATAAVVAVGWMHRTGRTSLLARIGGFSERVSGIPRWAAVPGAVTGVSLLVAVFGYYWDVSTHIDNGRDLGPFANPSHYFILVGLAGLALAGALAITYGCDDECPPTAVRLREGWRVPAGGLLLLLCGIVSLAGFPLDDVWHRLFGQDVTLWGPTHIQMIGGASLATLAQWLLFVEAQRTPARKERRTHEVPAWLMRVRDGGLAGAFLIGMSTLQGEFDFGVPQFHLLFHPLLIALAASVALVAARIRLGRGGAFVATGVYLAVRGALSLIIGPGLGRIALHFPLYLVEAALVEAVAARVGRDRQLTLGLWAGLAIGTVGLGAEWLWSHVWMPIPWGASLLPEALLVVLPAAVAGGVVGGAIGRTLAPLEVDRQYGPRWLPAAVTAVILAALAWPLPMNGPEGIRATIAQDATRSAPDGWTHATVRVDPPSATTGAHWFTVTAWQGAEWTDTQSVIDHLAPTDDGAWKTTTPIPVHGNWKALVRLHQGRDMLAAPIYMPEDAAIPAEEVPLRQRVTRDFVYGKELLQREAKDVSPWLWNVAYGVLALIGAAWIASLSWGLRRLDERRPTAAGRSGFTPEPRPKSLQRSP